ncbi:serine palmitoyltransferase component [Dimargaris cristalligena]|uniref:serine C-palmitoyltransferase n=1 Tax=Dimargaris cristalligena TaxID=215637 RepID=A0A4P9ZW69_9FUNG|nr:serine palmitoyltransferase component [Dimargaris cristalligena]RKP37853.1 pyridoxal phosphate-dependent transferase [Dimargaris cristalligena]|eukprot:RKP37853.1 pyridoxal phosphate-dependent transferase [Dimargaris cristalligena]
MSNPPAPSTLAWAWAQIIDTASLLPGSKIVIRYIKNSYQNDPFRIALEVFLLLFVVWYLLEKRYRIDHHEIPLNKQEVDELIDDWVPETLVPELTAWEQEELARAPVLSSGQSSKPVLAGSQSPVLNLASYNFLGLVGNEDLKERAVHTLRKYGVGSCGPPGFYGTLDVHMDLERKLADFVGADEAIIYSQGLTTTLSVIPCFSKRGDLLICDEGISFAVQKGIQITRSQVRYFKHNDMEDLERILREIRQEDQETKRTITRRFIVTEGLYINSGDVAPLPDLVRLKEQYKYRLILDESYSFGVLGPRGQGLAAHYGISTDKIDILIGSMCNALGSSGGFCAGRSELIEHQRLSGSGYVFSASLPAILAVYALDGLEILNDSRGGPIMSSLRANSEVMAKGLRALTRSQPAVTLQGANGTSPIIHLRLDRNWARTHLPLSDDAEVPQGTRTPLPIATRVEFEKVLQQVVDEALSKGILLTRAKYILDQERSVPDPSIRVCVSAAHSKKETEAAVQGIRNAVTKVIGSF